VQLTVEHIVSAIAKARAEAEILAGEFPEYQTALLRFAQEASRAQHELIAKVQPDLPHQ